MINENSLDRKPTGYVIGLELINKDFKGAGKI